MAVQNQSILLLAVLSILQIHFAQSLDIESTKELPCFKVSKTASTDMQWMMSVKKWYYVMGNRFDLYELAADVANKDLEEMTEDELYYKSCLTYEIGKDATFVATGFGGKQKSYKVNPLDANFGTVEFTSLDGGLAGTGYTLLTDNKTFAFGVTCYPDSNQMGWAVSSPYKSLPKKTIKLIHEKAKSLGFKKEHFTGLRFDSCDNDEEDARQEKNEL